MGLAGAAGAAQECKPGHVWESWSQGFPRAAQGGSREAHRQMWPCYHSAAGPGPHGRARLGQGIWNQLGAQGGRGTVTLAERGSAGATA